MKFLKTPIRRNVVFLAIGVCGLLVFIAEAGAAKSEGREPAKTIARDHTKAEKTPLVRKGVAIGDPVCSSKIIVDEQKCLKGETGTVVKYRRHFNVCQIGSYETSSYQYAAEVYANIECVERSKLLID
jgi:hypothetical protein